MDAELGCSVGGNRLRLRSRCRSFLMEDVTECVDVARGVAMRGQGEVIGPIALGCRPGHVVDDRVRVVSGPVGWAGAGHRTRLPRPHGRRRGGRYPLGDEVEGPPLVVRSPSTPVGQACVEILDLVWAHGLSGHGGTSSRSGRPGPFRCGARRSVGALWPTSPTSSQRQVVEIHRTLMDVATLHATGWCRPPWSA